MKHETTIEEFELIAGALKVKSKGRKILICRLALMHLLNDASQHMLHLEFENEAKLSDPHFYDLYEALDKRSATKSNLNVSKIAMRNLLSDHSVNSGAICGYKKFKYP